MYLEFKIQVIFPRELQIKRTNECVSTSLFIRFASLKGNVSCVFKESVLSKYVPISLYMFPLIS